MKFSLVPIIKASINVTGEGFLFVTSKQFLPLQDFFTFHSSNRQYQNHCDYRYL